MAKLSYTNVRSILKNWGLTEKEADIYIFIGQNGVKRSGEISKGTKIHRSEVYRVLKSLQNKGLVQSTLESPTRFSTVPFETVIDSFIKTKHEEAAKIEKAKSTLIQDWQIISKNIPSPQMDKFVVINGRQRIYSKILGMVNETKEKFSATSTASALVRVEEFGIIDAILDHSLKNKVQFRFLAELTDKNLKQAETLIIKISAKGMNIKWKTPELGLKLYPQLAIRDEEEAIFFIRQQSDLPTSEQDNICLWTNCKSLIHAFLAMFDDSWGKAQDINERIFEISDVHPLLETPGLDDITKKYNDTIYSAKKEILMMTSSQGIMHLSKESSRLSHWRESGVSVRIMTPVTGENLESVKTLSECCEVKHLSSTYLDTTIVDDMHLFRFKSFPIIGEITKLPNLSFENMFYTTNKETVEKNKRIFDDFWENAQRPSNISIESIMKPPETLATSSLANTFSKISKKITGILVEEEIQPDLSEKDVLNKIINAQTNPKETISNVIRTYGTLGQAIIHPSTSFNMPVILFHVAHCEKFSDLGLEDVLIIFLWKETAEGNFFVPAALVHDNSNYSECWRVFEQGQPFGRNIQLVKDEELQIKIHGNTLFCGWTVEIPLYPKPFSLKPSCLLLEGYGKLKTFSFIARQPGFTIKHEQNGFNAFVTFLNSESNYSGPGSEGWVGRDLVSTIYLL